MKAHPRFLLWLLSAMVCGIGLDSPGTHALGAQPFQEALARRAFGAVHPRVSPDGSEIAVSFQGTIAVMPSEGGTLTCLSKGEGWDIEPAWSPDGQRIAYVNASDFTVGELRVLRRDNGERVPLPKSVRARGPLHFH